MKTTNYEISKQLAEAGFKDDFEFGYTHDGQFTNYYGNIVSDRIKTPAYDLETLLEALPKFIKYNNREYCLTFWVACKQIYYEIIGETVRENDFYILITEQEENESLVDTAAKLWLKLKEEGIA